MDGWEADIPEAGFSASRQATGAAPWSAAPVKFPTVERLSGCGGALGEAEQAGAEQAHGGGLGNRGDAGASVIERIESVSRAVRC